MVLRKDQIEAALHAESQEISAGRLKEDNPLDTSEPFRELCEACRRGDLKVVHEKIAEGVNINARDAFDYTPLILVRRLDSIPLKLADLLIMIGKPLRPLRSRPAFTGIRRFVRERHLSR